MKTTKTEKRDVTICDTCRKNETEDKCPSCNKDLCKECSAHKKDYGNYLICKDCFDRLPEFVQENIEAVLRSSDEGGAYSVDHQPLNPEKYKRKGFYIFVVGNEDGSDVHYCKNKDEITEVLDEYYSEDNEDEVSDIYDESGNIYKIKRKVGLVKK